MVDKHTTVAGYVAAQPAPVREILDELRRRAGEMARPKEELDYIDRLLKTY